MKELNMKTKLEMVLACIGVSLSEFCKENGLHYSRTVHDLERNQPNDRTREKISNYFGFEIKTGYELIDRADNLQTKIEVALKRKGVEKRWLAEQLGCAPAYLSQKIRGENFSRKQWKKIGEILGAENSDMVFVIDGMVI